MHSRHRLGEDADLPQRREGPFFDELGHGLGHIACGPTDGATWLAGAHGEPHGQGGHWRRPAQGRALARHRARQPRGGAPAELEGGRRRDRTRPRSRPRSLASSSAHERQPHGPSLVAAAFDAAYEALALTQPAPGPRRSRPSLARGARRPRRRRCRQADDGRQSQRRQRLGGSAGGRGRVGGGGGAEPLRSGRSTFLNVPSW